MTTTSDRALPAPGEPPPVAESSTAPATRSMSGTDALRRLIRRVRFYAGVLVAPFLAILCLTGIAYAFTPQINDLVHPTELLVTVQDGPVAPLDRQVAAARAAHPGLPLTSVTPSTAPDRTTKVVLTPPGAADGDTLGVYVNPYTAQVTGALPLRHDEPPLQEWLRTFAQRAAPGHRRGAVLRARGQLAACAVHRRPGAVDRQAPRAPSRSGRPRLPGTSGAQADHVMAR
jgi:uncharacterized iron-regulated membrane protein